MERFNPDAFALLPGEDGRFMPCQRVGPDPENGEGFFLVREKGGKEYTLHETCLLTVEEALPTLRRDRAAIVSSTYEFRHDGDEIHCRKPGKKYHYTIPLD